VGDAATAEGAIRHIARVVYHYWGRAPQEGTVTG
jgi:hypothetical protein